MIASPAGTLPAQAGPGRAVVPAVQAAAVAAGGFVAGAAVVGLVHRRRRTALAKGRRAAASEPRRARRPLREQGRRALADRRQPIAARGRASAGRRALSDRSDLVELREEVRPAGPFRLPRRNGMDGVMRRRGGVLERLLHHEQEPVVVRIAQTAEDSVLFGARARTQAAARYGIARMRFALGVDDDLRPFRRRFAERPADRALGAGAPVAAGGTPPGAVRGARVGGLRAADRVRARGNDPEPAGSAPRTALDRQRGGSVGERVARPADGREAGRRRRRR